MRAWLRIVEGPSAGRRFLLAAGQAARVGSTEWADFAAPGDPQLADIHFVVLAERTGCRVRQAAAAQLLVNGQAVAEAALQSGDRITAGNTVFQIEWEGASGRASPAPRASATGAEEASSPTAPRLSREIAARAALSAPALALLEDDPPPPEYVAALLAADLAADAVKFRAAELSPAQAVGWAAQCVRRTQTAESSPQARAALEAAERWAADPTEDHRRQAEAAAVALNYDGAEAFVALAAFWSGDNLAPPGLPAAPVPAGLAGQGAAGAVLLAAPRLGLETIATTLRAFLADAPSAAQGQAE